MILPPAWRLPIVTAVAAGLAMWMGWSVAESNTLPTLVVSALLIFLVTRWLTLPLGTLLLGALLFGYIVGNRGFAQISLTTLMPILPAEGVLLLGGILLLVRCAWQHELPFRRDSLNLAVLLWIILGTTRVAFDIRVHGFSTGCSW
jgi:hypothetical protein